MTPALPASARLARLATLILGVLSLVLLAAVTLPSSSATRMTAWPWWAALRLLLAIPPLLLVVRTVAERKQPLRIDPVAGWLLMVLGLVPIISALLSGHGNRSLLAASTLPAAACLALWLADLLANDEKNEQRLAVGIGIAGGVFVVVSLVLWTATGFVPAWQRIELLNSIAGADVFGLDPDAVRNLEPLGHANYTAGVGMLLLPFFVGLAAAAQRRVVRIGWSVAGVATLVMLISTGSRAFALGLLAAGTFALVAIARARRWRRRKLARLLAGAFVAVLVLVAAVPRTRQAVLSLLAGEGLNVGDLQRIAMTRIGLRMGSEHWLLGQGPGMVPKLYPQYRHTVEGGADSVLQLHSTPLQLWADTGLPGLLLAALLTALILRRAWVGARLEEKVQIHIIAAGAAVAGYAALSLTDFQLDVPVIAGLLAAAVAVPSGTRTRVRSSRAFRIALTLFPLIVTAFSIQATRHDWEPRRVFAEAVARLEAGGDLDAFREEAENAIALDPGNPDYLAGTAAAHLRFLYADPDPTVRDDLATSIQLLLDRVLEIDPANEFARFNMGWLMLAEDPHEAAVHFRHAARLAPERGNVYLGLGLAHMQAGDPERAREAFALDLLDAPISVTSPAWDAELLAPHLEPAMRRAIELAPMLAPHDRLARTAQLFRWWLGDPAAAPEFPDELQGPVTRNTPGIAVLKAALHTPERRRELLASHLFIQTTDTPSEEQLNVIEHLLDTLGDDWLAWIKSPAGRDAPFVRNFRQERTAHAMLAGNLDLPVPIDANIVQANELVHLFFRTLFPPKGLPDDPRVVNHMALHGL